MKITLRQWREISAKTTAAGVALRDLEATLMHTMFAHANNQEERELLEGLLHRLDDGHLPCEVHPQSEWMGGDSSDPKNTKLREPNCCGLSNRRYFTEEEIAEAKDTHQ